jgi:hypothetical protein
MDMATSQDLPARPLALANLLTFARIAAVPTVVACLYWQDILQGGVWLRWVAVVIFISAGVTRRPSRSTSGPKLRFERIDGVARQGSDTGAADGLRFGIPKFQGRSTD